MGIGAFSLSTAWNWARHDKAEGLIGEIKALGFDSVELNFALTRRIVDDIVAMARERRIAVSSLHNICPLPEGVSPEKASPDHFSLSSTDGSERRSAVNAARNTIDYAARMGARAVVLHAGRVEIKDRTRELAASMSDAAASAAIRDTMIRERAAKAPAHIGPALDSIEQLIHYAKDRGVTLGLENRYYYREIPILEEFDAIFTRFGKGDIFYWHDVGHAEAFERLGLVKHADLLGKYSGRLLGIHLHDIIGCMGDHHAPGKGSFDFRAVAPFVKSDTIKVVEAHEAASGEDIRKSVSYLRGIFRAWGAI
jgi:sugar phosphate isomerase/epimerase